jgi:peptide-methionine (S)-S-oxide reductase
MTPNIPLRIILAAAALLAANISFAQEGIPLPAPAVDAAPSSGTETAIFAGGCFWGVQGVFSHVKGVVSATSGYAGGKVANVSYEGVSTGSTGLAESVQVVFDPAKVTYGHLLQIYFSVAHDPTELNRQGPDSGTQYRSAVFPVSDQQAKIAKAYIAQLGQAHLFDGAIVTKIEPGAHFYKAEDHHQDFLARNPTYPYIVHNDLPKISHLQAIFPGDYRETPVLVMK